MAQPLLGGDNDNSPNQPKSRLTHNIVEVLLYAILIFLIINLLTRTLIDTSTTAILSDSALTSIAFCILELLALLAVRACIMTEGIIYVRLGFWIYVFSLLCFIIESSTFYNKNILIFLESKDKWTEDLVRRCLSLYISLIPSTHRLMNQ